MKTTISAKLISLALAAGIFLTACGGTANENSASAEETTTPITEPFIETTAPFTESTTSFNETTTTFTEAVHNTTFTTAEKEIPPKPENAPSDLTGTPVGEVFDYTVYDNHAVINKCIQFGEKITVPEEIDGVKVTEIGEDAFISWDDFPDGKYISEIVLPDSIEVIGKSAFAACGSITGLKLNIPKNLKKLGEYAFSSSGLSGEIVIPKTVSEIQENAFIGCHMLESVIIENGVTALPDSCFYECNTLDSIVIPDSVTSLGEHCFAHCSSLESIDIPASVNKIGLNAFKKTPFLNANQPLIINNMLVDHSTASGDIVIPENVTVICEEAYKKSGLTSVVIPDSVTEIEKHAFSWCKKLKSVTLPKNITEIKECTFFYCESLKSISIPDGVTRIGNEAFYKSGLESADIPESIAFIGISALSGTPFAASQQPLIINNILCDWSTASGNVTVPGGVTSIAGMAFGDNENLTAITIPDTVTRIEEMAFRRCQKLAEINIPSSVEFIGSMAFDLTAFEKNSQPLIINGILFSWDTASGDVAVPDGVRTIDAYAFYGCETVTSITVPDSVTSIGDGAFAKCPKLVSVSLPSGVELGSGVFDDTPAAEDSSAIQYRK